MSEIPKVGSTGFIFTLTVLVLGFLILYWNSNEWISSLFAAVLTAILAFASYIMILWLAKVFSK